MGFHMGVSKYKGTPKWMVYNGKPMKTLLKWMIWWYPYFWKHPYKGLIRPAISGGGVRQVRGVRGG